MKVLYIGAGLHIQPLETFKECKEFVFIDSCPINEYGFEYDDRLYCKNFMKLLLRKINKYGFNKVSEEVLLKSYDNEHNMKVKHINPTCLTFSKEDITLKYYISCGLPRYIDIVSIKKDISECDTLVISGHHPHNCIVKYMPSKINLVYYSKTWIPKTMEELKETDSNYETNIFFNILQNPEMVLSERLVKYK